jgi:hypothetical protein
MTIESDDLKAVITHYSPENAKLAAVEILLADPASLGDDCLESCLYELRERLENPDGTAPSEDTPPPEYPEKS